MFNQLICPMQRACQGLGYVPTLDCHGWHGQATNALVCTLPRAKKNLFLFLLSECSINEGHSVILKKINK